MPRALRVIIYPIFTVICFLFFFMLLFPWNSIRLRASNEIEKALGGSVHVSIEALSYAFPAGFNVNKMTLTPVNLGSPIKIQKGRLKFDPIALLGGDYDMSLYINGEKGKIEGQIFLGKNGVLTKLKLDSFDLSWLNLWLSKRGINLSGLVNGKIDLELNNLDPMKNEGRVTLQIPEFKVAPMTLAGGFLSLPEIKLSQLETGPGNIDFILSQGNVELKLFDFKGGDLEIQSDGKLYGARTFDNYRVNLKGTFKPSEVLGKAVPFLSYPTLDKNKNPDGSYPFTLTGKMNQMSPRIGDFKIPGF